MPTKERRGCIRRIEDKDILERMAVLLTSIQTTLKLVNGDISLIRHRLVQIEKKLGLHHE